MPDRTVVALSEDRQWLVVLDCHGRWSIMSKRFGQATHGFWWTGVVARQGHRPGRARGAGRVFGGQADMSTEQNLREALRDMVEQFAYRDEGTLGPVYNTGGLSALEQAFQVLGWDDPHPVPERACEVDGCMRWGTCVGPKPDGSGFGLLCYPHFSEGQRT